MSQTISILTWKNIQLNKLEAIITKRKTYNNVLKAARLIQRKGYAEKESLEIAVQKFDELEQLHNGMSVEWLIEKMCNKQR